MHNTNLVLKSGFWYVIGNFIAKSIGFITTPIFTRILTTGEVGDFSNLVSWVQILTIIATFNLHSSVAVAQFDYKGKLNDYIKSNLILGSTITVVVYLICIIFHSFFTKYTGLSLLEMHIIFAYLICYPASQMLLIKSRLDYNYKTNLIISIVSLFSSTLISLFLVLIFQNKLLGRIYGHFIPLIVINLIIYLYYFRLGKSLNVIYWKYSLTIMLPYIGHILAGSLLGSSDRVMIKYFLGNDDTAYYSIAYYCSLLFSVLWSAINNAWSPWEYEQVNKKKQTYLRRGSKLLVAFMSSFIFLFLLIEPEILYLMGGKAYLQALYVIPPIMTAYVFQVVYSLYVNVEFYCKKQIYIAIGTAIAAIINIALNFTFIPVLGYIAAAYTTLVGFAVLYLIHFNFVKKLGYAQYFDARFNNKCLIISLLVMVLSNILYQNPVLRLTVLSIISLALYILFRKEVYYLLTNKSFYSIIKKILKIKSHINL